MGQKFERLVDVTGRYVLDFGLGDYDSLRFFIETAHAEFTREELLAAFYMAQKGKEYKTLYCCPCCNDSGGMLSSRKHGTRDEWTVGFLLCERSTKQEYRVAMSCPLFTQAILHNIL